MEKRMKKNILPIMLMIFVFNLALGHHIKKFEMGKASYYAKKFEGRKTANGEIFSNNKFTAAHKTLPMGSVVRVTNLANSRSVDVRINDRGPFRKGRIIDLSERAFLKIADKKLGVVDVSVRILKIN